MILSPDSPGERRPGDRDRPGSKRDGRHRHRHRPRQRRERAPDHGARPGRERFRRRRNRARRRRGLRQVWSPSGRRAKRRARTPSPSAMARSPPVRSRSAIWRVRPTAARRQPRGPGRLDQVRHLGWRRQPRRFRPKPGEHHQHHQQHHQLAGERRHAARQRRCATVGRRGLAHRRGEGFRGNCGRNRARRRLPAGQQAICHLD